MSHTGESHVPLVSSGGGVPSQTRSATLESLRCFGSPEISIRAADARGRAVDRGGRVSVPKSGSPDENEIWTLRPVPPSALGFLRRYDSSGYVYVAHSFATGLCKVGTAQFEHLRVDELNRRGYGGTTDWYIVASVACERAGPVEAQAHRSLAEYRQPSKYYWGRRWNTCYETFRCEPEEAVAAVHRAKASV